MPTNADIDNSTIVSSASKKPQQLQISVQELKKDDYSHKGEICHSKNTEGSNKEYPKPDIKSQIKDKIEKVVENN